MSTFKNFYIILAINGKWFIYVIFLNCYFILFFKKQKAISFLNAKRTKKEKKKTENLRNLIGLLGSSLIFF